MNKNNFLHIIRASANEVKAIVEEAQDSIYNVEKEIDARKKRIDRAKKHLQSLFSIIDILYLNLPEELITVEEKK